MAKTLLPTRPPTAAADPPLPNESAGVLATPSPQAPPPAATTPTTPEPPASAPDDNDGQTGFDNNAVRIEVPKQGVFGTTTAKRAKAVEDQCAAIKDRIEKLEKNVYKRIDRLQGTVTFMSKCVEDFNDNFGSIMDLVREQRVREVANDLTEEFTFPLKSTVDVQAYIEQDPQMVRLIDRYVHTDFDSEHFRRVDN